MTSHDSNELAFIAALERRGLVYRPGSALHVAYLENKTVGLTLAKVINKTATQKFLREHTDYEEVLGKLHTDKSNVMSRQEKIARAKQLALKGTPIPPKWPWEVDEHGPDVDGFTVVSRQRSKPKMK